MQKKPRLILRIFFAVLAFYLVIYYWGQIAGFGLSLLSALAPIFYGFVVAYLVSIPMALYERFYFPNSQKALAQRSRRPVCMLLAYLSVTLVVVLVVVLIVPELVNSIILLTEQIPLAAEGVLLWLQQNLNAELWAQIEGMVGELDLDWQSLMTSAWDFLVSGFGGVMDAVTMVVSGTVSAVITGFLSFIFSIYLLAQKETLGRQLRRLLTHYLKEKWLARVLYLRDILHQNFKGFIVGQCTEAVILGVLCVLGMQLLRLPYATMIGTLVGFVSLIPVAGAYLGAIVGAFLILMQSPVQALIFVIFLVVLQQLEGNLIYPRVVGASVGLPAIWVLGGITVGGSLMGVLGMLIAVPLVGALYQILRDDINKQPLSRE